MGRPLLLCERSDSGLNARSPPVSGGSAKIRRAERHCFRRKSRQHRVPQEVLHKRGPEFQAAGRSGSQSHSCLRIPKQFRNREVCGAKHIPDRPGRQNREGIYRREPGEPQQRSPHRTGPPAERRHTIAFFSIHIGARRWDQPTARALPEPNRPDLRRGLPAAKRQPGSERRARHFAPTERRPCRFRG